MARRCWAAPIRPQSATRTCADSNRSLSIGEDLEAMGMNPDCPWPRFTRCWIHRSRRRICPTLHRTSHQERADRRPLLQQSSTACERAVRSDTKCTSELSALRLHRLRCPRRSTARHLDLWPQVCLLQALRPNHFSEAGALGCRLCCCCWLSRCISRLSVNPAVRPVNCGQHWVRRSGPHADSPRRGLLSPQRTPQSLG